MPFYQYTCKHGHERITASGGVLRPVIELAGPRMLERFRDEDYPTLRFTSQLIWLTTIPNVVWLNAGVAGLYMEESAKCLGIKPCDRTQYRWEVVDTRHQIVPWVRLRERWPIRIVAEIEDSPGARPKTWWVARGPLQARYSPHRAVA